MQTLELRIPPLALVLIFAGFMAMLAYFVPFAIPVPFAGVLSIIIAAAGAAVAVAGVSAFRKHKTTVNPFTPEQSSALVASGIYSYTRNPMYLGFLLALIGLGVYLSNLPSLVLLPAFIAYMNRFQIQPEERALQEHFGDEFQVYVQTVRRWL